MNNWRWAELIILAALLVLVFVANFVVGESPGIFWRLLLMVGLALVVWGLVRLFRYFIGRRRQPITIRRTTWH